MKNLEIKLKQGEKEICTNNILNKYIKTLNQKDIYLKTRNKECRVKIRQEDDGNYAINYYRENVEKEKISTYTFYKIESVDDFMNVFGESVDIELVVEKKRELYLYDNARIHIDDVKNLGKFIEIEIVINNDEEEKKSQELLEKLMEMLNLNQLEKIAIGYREMLFNKLNNISTDIIKDYKYYRNCKKVFWYINDDITNTNFKRNQIIPSIFVEVIGDEYYILQLDLKDVDLSEEEHKYKWTGWRKIIGEKYKIRVDVLLISDENNVLYDLNGKKINFENLKYSTKHIDKSYLAKFI